MKVLSGKSFRMEIDDNRYLDISVYHKKYVTIVNMGLWEKGNPIAINSVDDVHFNFEKILPNKIATLISEFVLNRQALKTAGVRLSYKRKGGR